MGARASCCFDGPAQEHSESPVIRRKVGNIQRVETPFAAPCGRISECGKISEARSSQVSSLAPSPKVGEASPYGAAVQRLNCFFESTKEESTKESVRESTEEQQEEPAQGGCFLVYSEESQGTLRMQWSEVDVDGALAVLRPGKAVPAHKYSTNQGRSDIMKQANLGVHKQRHCEAFAQFIKAGRAFDSTLEVFSSDIRVYLSTSDELVQEVAANRSADLSGAVAVCVLPRDAKCLSGVQKLNLEQFAFQVQSANGGFLKF